MAVSPLCPFFRRASSQHPFPVSSLWIRSRLRSRPLTTSTVPSRDRPTPNSRASHRPEARVCRQTSRAHRIVVGHNSTGATPAPPQPEMSEPTGLIATSGIELLTLGTPNGLKASILLEELKEAYGRDYTVQKIDISKGTQKEPWFTAINPNGRIPAIVDHDRGGFAVFEGNAILSYLSRHYDPDHKFSFPIDSDDYSVAEQWIGWQHGGVGPMQGQANHFLFAAPEKIPYAIQRYVGETERLYGILDKRLADRDYVAGEGRGRYSIADIALLGWTGMARASGLDTAQFPNVFAWWNRCAARPATRRGLGVPSGPSSYSNEALAKKDAEGDEEHIKKQKEKADLIAAAKEKYNYKYSSP